MPHISSIFVDYSSWIFLGKKDSILFFLFPFSMKGLVRAYILSSSGKWSVLSRVQLRFRQKKNRKKKDESHGCGSLKIGPYNFQGPHKLLFKKLENERLRGGSFRQTNEWRGNAIIGK